MTRREVLRLMGVGAVAGTTGRLCFGQSPSFMPDVELALRAGGGEARILPGPSTRVWRFTGEVLKGPPQSLEVIPDSYLGPILRLRKGQKVRIRFANALPEPSIVHWHGMDMPAAMDGHPQSVIDPQTEFIYEFEVTNRAGTYWYHPHPHSRTGPQVYNGLAGLLLVSDDEERALNLPSGPEEIVCVLQDRSFDAGNQLTYVSGGMMEHAQGFLGDRVLVNGIDRPSLALATRAYRLRLLNGSNARIYKLEWSDGAPLTVIGTDGGLLQRSIEQAYVTLAPGQRADVILDLSERDVGTSFELRSAPFSSEAVDAMGMMGVGMSRGMGGGMGRRMGMGMGMPQASVPNGSLLSLLTVHVDRREESAFHLPEQLSTFDASWDAAPTIPPRRVTLGFQHGQWLLDGRIFDMHDATPEETVAARSTQVWEIVNSQGMMGMQMAHPIHLHGRQFRILSREGLSTAGALVAQGSVDAGWHDTVLVMPGETVRIKIPFTDHPGLYLYHCHILEHEDMGMMRNFRVIRAGRS
jgi:FtsP/CotA-like multicopper oxidase with cupredoxin domain